MNGNRIHTALAMGLALVLAGSVPAIAAEAPDGPSPEGAAVVRVLNHYTQSVRVFVFDAEGRRFALGEVEAGGFSRLEIPEAIATRGPVEVKVYPGAITGGLAHGTAEGRGVKTRPLTVDGGDVIDFWLEPDLLDSMIRVERG